MGLVMFNNSKRQRTMKKYIFYTLAAVVTFLTFSCSKDTEVQTPDKPVPVDPIVSTEKSVVLSGAVDATKVSSDNNGAYKWQASDIITILTDNGTNREFTAEEAGISTDFSGHIPDADELEGGFALYPASENHSISGTTITFNVPNELAWGADASYMPMYAPITIVEQKPSASFKAVGGALKLILYNIPSSAAKLAFTAASMQISGEFLFDSTDETPVIEGGNTDNAEAKTIKIDFSDNYSANKVFYIPLPVVTLTGGFTISLLDANDVEVFSKSSSKAVSIARNHLVIAAALNCASSQTLWSEDFLQYSDADVPGAKDGEVYHGATGYACVNGKNDTKIYPANLAGGSSPELLINQQGGSFTVSGISTKGAASMVLTFKVNNTVSVSATSGITVGSVGTGAGSKTVNLTNTGELSSFDLTFSNSSSKNVRIDDIVVSTVPTSFTAPTISAGAEELTIGVGQSSASTTVSLANAIDGLGISALVSGTDAENFTAAIDGTTLTVTAKAANTTAADKVATVTLKASGASSKAISVTQTSCLVPNPTDLTAIAGDAEVDVTWTGDAHATSYVAYLHTAATETPATGGTDITSSISNSGTNYKIEDYSSVDNDQTYYLYIKVNEVASGYVAPTDYAVVSFTPAQAKGTAENPYLASEAYDIVSAYASGEGPTGTIYVKGYVSTAYNPSSNSQTYFISDDGSTNKQFEAYSGKGISGADITDANKVSVGDWIVACGTAKNYSGTTPEFVAGSTIITHNPKLAAPTFSPEAGTYYSAQSVAISATNSATIYYTTDGTDPDENSDEYEEPIAVSADMTIKAIAVKADFVNSAVASAAYDIEAPTKLGTPVINVDSYNHNSIAFSWAAVDNATGYQVSTDGGSSWLTKQEETSYTWTGLSASTSYTIKVKAIGTDNGQYTDSDVASNSQTTSAPVTLVSIALTTAPTKTTYNVGETFSFAGAVVTATYSDSNTADVTASCTTDYDGVTFSTTGVKTVTVSYTEGSTQTTTFKVTVAIIDVLTSSWAGTTSGSSYGNWSDKQGSASDAVYAGNSCRGVNYIQLRSTNPSGIVSTSSGGTVKSVTVTWNSTTTDGRTLDIYGKNTEYSSGADLYSSEAGTQGKKVGSIVKGTSNSYTFDIDYEFIGLRSNSGAMYIDQIDIEWAAGDPTIAMAKTSISGVAAAGVNNASESGVYTFKGGATDADVTVTCDGEIVTSASKNNGSLTYTVAANTGTAREGWIKVQYASESAHTVTVSQNAATYTLTLSSGGNGTVAATVDNAAVASGSAVAVGKTVSITATPSSGYLLASLNYNDDSAHDIISTKSFTMPSAAVTVTATFEQGPTITMNTTSITDVAAAGGSFTATSAYTLENGASNDDVEITCDGCVTAASKAATAGNISYEVAKNTGAAREGHIYVKYSTEAAHTITVSQLAGQSDPVQVYKLTTAKSTSNTAYANNYSVTINNVKWSAPGNQNFTGYWRIGGKKANNTNLDADRVIYSNGTNASSLISSDVDAIVIETNGVSNANLSVSSISITVHNSSSDASSGTNPIATFTTSATFPFNTASTATDFTFTKSGTTDCTGKYYRIVFHVKNSTTTNYGLDVKSITFYSN